MCPVIVGISGAVSDKNVTEALSLIGVALRPMDLNDSGKTSSSNEHSLNAFSPNSTIPLKSTDVKFAPPLSKALFPMI